MLVSQNVPNLINGVSQQAEDLRYPSQCIEQENYYPTVLRGLSKRPPTRHVKTLETGDAFGGGGSGGDGNYGVHKIDRSPAERFQAIISGTGIRVFDLDGNEVTVNAPGGFGYLACSKPAEQIRTLTVADYTFVVNTTKVVQAQAQTPSSVRAPEALVFVKQVRDGADYFINFYDDPNSTSGPSHVVHIADVKLGSASTYGGPLVADQGDIVQALAAGFSGSSANGIYTFATNGELIYIKKVDGSNFRVEIECSIPEGMFAFKDSVQNFSLLPQRGWAGFRLKVKGDPEDAGDDYYLKFVPTVPSVTSGFCEGSWEEAQAGGLTDDVLVAGTLPHALVNHGTHFTFGPLTWDARACGDAETNPAPSFVGGTIDDIFFRKNRLGFLSGENTLLSCAGKFFNFWRTTVIQLLDSDVIDIAAAHVQVGLLKNVCAAAERVVLFSERSQFILEEGELLTPRTVGIKPASEYSSIPGVRPAAVGNSIYFPFKRGEFSGFIEYSVAPETGLFSGEDVTEHAPNYIRGTVRSFVAADSVNALIAQADEPDVLYVYKFFRRGTQRLQSSWSKFRFRGRVRGFNVIDTRLYVLIRRDGDLTLEYVDLAPGLSDTDVDGNAQFVTHLDRRITDVETTSTYDPALQRTAVVLPYAPNVDRLRVVDRAAYGAPLLVAGVDGSTVYLHGDTTGMSTFIGEVYRSEQELTRPAMRETKSDGNSYVVPGRFQVRTGTILTDATLDFQVEVTPKGRPTFVYGFAPRVLGTDSAVAGSGLKPRSVPFRFPVFSKNDQVTIKIVNESYLPCNLLSLEWEALYVVRARRT